jgi:predicted phage terminase large subunit-like protein
VVAVKVKGSKISRVEGVVGLFESGRVHFPAEASWMPAFEDELLRFPAAAHDDMVDALVIALSNLRRQPVEWSFAFASNDPMPQIPKRRNSSLL